MGLLDRIRWIDEEYWLRIVTGSFGSGKTKNTYREAFLRKQKNPDWILIANTPYENIDGTPLVDIPFSSKKDLQNVLSYLFIYLDQTNTNIILKDQYFPPIRLIVDEAHLYYFSRDFKSFDMEMMTILTQCRKRMVTMYFITQELSQIDKFLRRLAPEVIMYTKWPLNLVYKSLYYFKSTEKSDISDEYNVEEISSRIVWWDKLVLWFNKDLQTFFDQRYLTNYVCWLSSLFIMTYIDFFNFIKERRDSYLDYYKEDANTQDGILNDN